MNQQELESQIFELALKLKTVLSTEESDANNAKYFYLSNFLGNYFRRIETKQDQLESENNIQTDYKYVDFHSLSKL